MCHGLTPPAPPAHLLRAIVPSFFGKKEFAPNKSNSKSRRNKMGLSTRLIIKISREIVVSIKECNASIDPHHE